MKIKLLVISVTTILFMTFGLSVSAEDQVPKPAIANNAVSQSAQIHNSSVFCIEINN